MRLELTGPTDRPRVSIDLSETTRAASEALKRRAADEALAGLARLLGARSEESDGESDEVGDGD